MRAVYRGAYLGATIAAFKSTESLSLPSLDMWHNRRIPVALKTTSLILLLGLCGVASSCYSPKLKSCLSACDSDSDCAPGHRCLAEESLCINKDHPVQECRGTQEIADPILFFSFREPILDNSLVERSGHLVPALIEGRSSDPVGEEGDPEVLSIVRTNEFYAAPHLQLSGPYSVATWAFVRNLNAEIPIFTEEFADGSYRTLLGLDSSGRLEVRLSCEGSDGSDGYTARSDIRVPRETWVHMAAVVTGQWVFFYHDGLVVDVAALNPPTEACEPADHYHFLYAEPSVGSVLLSEFRYFDVPLPETEVARLSALGREESPARCGDGIIDPDEACDGHSSCCGDDCAFLDDGSACAGSGTCLAGACSDSAVRAADPTLLYAFDTAGSSIVSEVGSLDLPLSTPGDVGSYDFSDGALSIEGRVVASAEVGQTLDACKTGGMSIEVTIEDGAAVDDGPPRIVSLSRDGNGGDEVFDLGPNRGQYILRFKGGFSDSYGRPTLYSPKGDAQAGKKTHLVATVSAEGERFLYVDGVRRASFQMRPGIEDWEETVPLTIANIASCNDDGNGCRDWEGRLYTVAIYCRPLSELEVGNNAAAELAPGATFRAAVHP